MYDYLKPDISKMEQMVKSLNAFHGQTHGLDTHHQEQLNTFRNTLMSLFNGPVSFEGPAADAMMNLVSNYLQNEQAFVGSVGDTSPRLSTATSYCVTTANDIEQQLQSLYREADSYAYELDVDRSIPFAGRELRRVADPTFPSEEELSAFCPLPPSAQTRVGDMDIDKMQWEGNMNTLGGEPLPPLPQTPSTSNIIFPPGTPIDLGGLTLQQQREVQDLLAKYPGVSQSDIENLVSLGYDEASLAIILTRLQAALKNGADQYGLSADDLRILFAKVANALNSGDKDRVLEGQTALLVLSNLISFQRTIVDPNTGLTITDIDVETPDAIIEVTNAQQGKLGQITVQRTNPYVNPSGKPVILFAPLYKATGVKNMKNLGIPYAKTLDELRQLLKEMFGGQ